MTKQYDEQLLLDYIEGNLSPAQRADLERRLQDQPQMLRYLRDMTGDREALSNLPEPEAPAWIMDEVDRRLERSMLLDFNGPGVDSVVDRQRNVVRRIAMLSGLAAMFLITGLVVGYSLWGFGDPGMPVAQRSDTPSSTAVAMGKAGPEAMAANQAVVQSKPGGAMVAMGKSAGQRLAVSPSPPRLLAKADAVDATPDTELLAEAVTAVPVMSVEMDAARVMPAKAQAMVAEAEGAQPAGQSLAQQPDPAMRASQSKLAPYPDNVEIVVQTDDLPSSVAQLNEVTRNLRAAELRETVAMSKAAARSDAVRRYTLTVPADQVPALFTQLRQPLRDGNQRVAFNRIETTTTTTVTTRTRIVRQLVDGNAWPRTTPDYNQIIIEQLPLPETQRLQEVDAARRVTMPVKVEKVQAQ
jgi:anti-sigma factor RsiW